jgi:hypothetical protein
MNDKLVKIQSELKAPKGQTNSFGNYKYRSCEDILEAVKPLLAEQDMIILLSDEVINIGTHNYVKATATIKASNDNTDGISVSAYAREAETKKGMDDAQITGAASSYARKYALNGLFAIDDTKDADSHDNRTEAPKPVAKPVQDPLAVAKNNLQKALKSFGYDNDVKMKLAINRVLKKNTVDTVDEANEVTQALEDGAI